MYYEEGEEKLEFTTNLTVTNTQTEFYLPLYFSLVSSNKYNVIINGTKYTDRIVIPVSEGIALTSTNSLNSPEWTIYLSTLGDDLGIFYDWDEKYRGEDVNIKILSPSIIHQIPEKYIPDSAKGLSPEEKVQFTEALAKALLLVFVFDVIFKTPTGKVSERFGIFTCGLSIFSSK
jgi:hypothetical protein